MSEVAISLAARILVDSSENWESTTKEEREAFGRIIIQEVGVDVVNKHILSVQVHPDYEPRFAILHGIYQDSDRRF